MSERFLAREKQRNTLLAKNKTILTEDVSIPVSQSFIPKSINLPETASLSISTHLKILTCRSTTFLQKQEDRFWDPEKGNPYEIFAHNPKYLWTSSRCN